MSSQEKKSKSSQILKEVRLKKESEQITNVDEETVKLVIFTLIEDYFAVPGAEAKEILPSRQGPQQGLSREVPRPPAKSVRERGADSRRQAEPFEGPRQLESEAEVG